MSRLITCALGVHLSAIALCGCIFSDDESSGSGLDRAACAPCTIEGALGYWDFVDRSDPTCPAGAPYGLNALNALYTGDPGGQAYRVLPRGFLSGFPTMGIESTLFFEFEVTTAPPRSGDVLASFTRSGTNLYLFLRSTPEGLSLFANDRRAPEGAISVAAGLEVGTTHAVMVTKRGDDSASIWVDGAERPTSFSWSGAGEDLPPLTKFGDLLNTSLTVVVDSVFVGGTALTRAQAAPLFDPARRADCADFASAP